MFARILPAAALIVSFPIQGPAADALAAPFAQTFQRVDRRCTDWQFCTDRELPQLWRLAGEFLASQLANRPNVTPDGLVTALEGGQPGLLAEYFDNPTQSGAPALRRIDEHVSFSWDRPASWPTGTGGKQVSARWTGTFVPPSTGEYRFAASTYGLDQYRLFVDGKLIMDRARDAIRTTLGRD